MKTLSLLFIALLLCSFTGRVGGSWAGYHLRGMVRSMTEYAYYNMAGDDNYSFKTVYTFDDNGMETGQKSYNAAGNIVLAPIIWDHKYDDRDDHAAENLYNTDSLTSSWKTIFTYADNGTSTETRTHDDGLIQEKIIYRYDDKGNKTGEVTYNGKGFMHVYTLLKYDVHGNLTDEVSRDGTTNGAVEKTITRTYDSKNNLTDCHYIERNDADTTTAILDEEDRYSDFDSHGNWQRWTTIIQTSGQPNTQNFRREISYY